MKWSDLNSEIHYDKREAYNQSKLANVMFTMELSKRLQGKISLNLSLLPFRDQSTYSWPLIQGFFFNLSCVTHNELDKMLKFYIL